MHSKRSKWKQGPVNSKQQGSSKFALAKFTICKMQIASAYASVVLSLLVIGGCLNGLELWLIVWHSPKEMHIYSQILLQISAADLLTLLLDPFILPVSTIISKIKSLLLKGKIILLRRFLKFKVVRLQIAFTSNAAFMELFLGPAGSLPIFWQNAAFSFEMWLYFGSIGALSTEFIYRYLVLNK